MNSMSLESVISESVKAYGPMLQKIDLTSKTQLYQAIYADADTATEEMLSLGCAITADPHFQNWLNAKLLLPKS